MTPFSLLGIDHVVLRIADLDKSLAFYVGVLGCTVDKLQEDIGLIQLRAGHSQIDLVPLSGKRGKAGGAGPGAEGRNVDHFALDIAPFDEVALRAHLERHGIAVERVARRYGAKGYGPSLYIADPDGNKVELKGPPDER
jgi:glyoxylase I family protein